MLLALAGLALFENNVCESYLFISIECAYDNIIAVSLSAGNTCYSKRFYLFSVNLAPTRNTDYVDILAYNSMLLDKLIEAVCVTGLHESKDLAFLAAFLNKILRYVCSSKVVINEVLVNFLRSFKNRRSNIIRKFALFPADNTVNGTVCEELLCSFNHYFLHLRSSNLRLGPSFLTASVNSFIVAANFAPSAAETHSTLVLSRSIPRKSSILKRSVILLLVK